MLQFKEGVKLNLASPAVLRLVLVLHNLSIEDETTYTITSGNDSKHMTGSRHYTDEAIDVRTKFLTQAAKKKLRQRYEAALGVQFRCILEGLGTSNEHMHAQVRKNHVYDPNAA